MKKFYCQNCNREVPLEADSCPYCSKEFGSVLCPKCNYSGGANKFSNGCPKCGYLKTEDHVKSKTLSLRRFLSLLFTLIGIIIILLLQF